MIATKELDRADHDAAPLALIEAAIDKGIDPQRILDFYERVQQNKAAESFARAVTKFQTMCPRITKSRTAKIQGGRADYQYTYAGYDDIDKVIRPLLIECELVVTFSTKETAKGIEVTCYVRHGIHVAPTSLTVPVPAMGNNTQAMGAALSYAKRYAIQAALNIVCCDEDNDASGMACITESQVNEINKIIETKSDPSKWLSRLLQVMRADSLDRIPARRYNEAISLLNKKPEAKK